MKIKRFRDEQITRILQEAETGALVANVYRKYKCSEQSFYRWKAKFGMIVLELKRLRELEHENAERSSRKWWLSKPQAIVGGPTSFGICSPVCNQWDGLPLTLPFRRRCSRMVSANKPEDKE